MRAVVYEEYGPPGVLELRDIGEPTPQDDEVLIRVHAASINSWDWDLLRGEFLNRLIFRGYFKPKLQILGCDVAGRVMAVGKAVERLQVGDEVFGDLSGCGWGGFAEYVCARENVMARKSPDMTFEDAAAVPQAAVLALQGLRHEKKIQPGAKVLINGAGGGVGTFAVQICKSAGAEVTGVDAASKLDTLRSIGADHVIDFSREDFTESGQRYDLILDVVGRRSIFDYRRALGPAGTYVMIGGATSRVLQLLFVGPWISRFGNNRMSLLLHKPDIADLSVFNQLFEARKVAPVVDRIYPLSEIAAAFRYYGEGHVRGKLVISLDEYIP